MHRARYRRAKTGTLHDRAQSRPARSLEVSTYCHAGRRGVSMTAIITAMASTIYFPPPRPALKLVRTTPPAPAAIAHAGDEPAAREADAGQVRDPALEEAWRKLHRARELFEAEQAHLRDDRLKLAARETELQIREQNLACRESRVAELERRPAAAAEAVPTLRHKPAAAGPAVARVAGGPLKIARALFRGGD